MKKNQGKKNKQCSKKIARKPKVKININAAERRYELGLTKLNMDSLRMLMIN
jgi:hypothetical protein